MSCFTRHRRLVAYGGYITEIVWRRVGSVILAIVVALVILR